MSKINAYIYCADIYCENCGKDIISFLDSRGKIDTGDSDDYPQGPYSDGGGEADSPNHCGSYADCINALELPDFPRVGMFLENPLTTDGYDYVKDKLSESPDNPVCQLWAEYYLD